MDYVKSVMTLHSGKVIKNLFLNLVKKMMNQSLRVRKMLNPNIAKKKKRTDSPPVLSFFHAITNQRKVNHISKSLKFSNS